mgnify:CR=1 FL=1|tara:strand:+ start:918 stop:2069 length:1152 start_codon:yes stop_codon:yes gene_type:complete
MNISKNIYFKNFSYKKPKKKIIKLFNELVIGKNPLIESFRNSYKNSYSKNLVIRLRKFKYINLIGIGGSSLGSRSIYNFFKGYIKKNFIFLDNLNNEKFKIKKDRLNLIISKSGNTLETIANINFHIKKNQKNVFITENKKNYLSILAKKLESEVVHHNNFIGGRFSVLSEVGMLPAEIMGLNCLKFRQFNNLIKNKKFINSLINNVSSTLDLIKNNKTNSIILNYDQNSSDLFYWYQQLVAESLGKNNKGLFPVVSNMPKDNHSLMQLYLAGKKNNFFTFFFVKENSTKRIRNKEILNSHAHLRNKNVDDIKLAQFYATQKVFKQRNIPFRSFFISKRNEETLGMLFTFFMLETILLGKAMNIDPYNQPAVELIKTETKKLF